MTPEREKRLREVVSDVMACLPERTDIDSAIEDAILEALRTADHEARLETWAAAEECAPGPGNKWIRDRMRSRRAELEGKVSR